MQGDFGNALTSSPAGRRHPGAAPLQHGAALALRLPPLPSAGADPGAHPGVAPRQPGRPRPLGRQPGLAVDAGFPARRPSCWSSSSSPCPLFPAISLVDEASSRIRISPRHDAAGHDARHRHGGLCGAHAARQPDRGAGFRLCPHGRAEGPAAARVSAAPRAAERAGSDAERDRAQPRLSDRRRGDRREGVLLSRASAACWSMRCSCATCR